MEGGMWLRDGRRRESSREVQIPSSDLDAILWCCVCSSFMSRLDLVERR